MKFEDLNLPESPYRGYYVNNRGDSVSIDSLDLISHITDNLYVGGCVHGVELENFFSHVFSLYMWERYSFGENTKYAEVKMYDSARDPIDIEAVESMSDAAVEALNQGGNVLIHCQAGINRSNLVTARVLMKWKDMTASEAIALLREKRSPIALANKTFEDWLLSL